MIRLSRAQLREVDRIAIEEYGLPGVVLMENAARSAAAIIDRQFSDKLPRVALIVCGTGNNAGDGYALARHLLNDDWEVKILALTPIDALKGDAAIMARVAHHMGITVTSDLAAAFDGDRLHDEPFLAVDAITGTGLTRPLAGDMAAAAKRLSQRREFHHDYKIPIAVALDVPSGLDCDTGEPVGDACVRANYTISFVAEKAGFGNLRSYPFTGEVRVADIGCPREIMARVSNP